MTRTEAQELLKDRAPVKHKGNSLLLLQTLFYATKRAHETKNFENSLFTVNTASVLRRVPVKERQLYNLLNKLEEVEVKERTSKKITYRLDFRTLLLVKDTIRNVQERDAAARTEAARQRMAKLRAESKAQREYAPPFSETSQTPITMGILRRCFPFRSGTFAPLLCMN
jgi:hypothetical protein